MRPALRFVLSLLLVALVVPAPAARAATLHCGEDLLLIVRGSSEAPQGEQPTTLTYQQEGDDLFARPLAEDPTGSGRLGEAALAYMPQGDAKIAALVYPATAIRYKGGVTPTLDNFHASAALGAEHLLAALRTLIEPCGANPPHIVVTGYSQGSDVINIAISKSVDSGDTHLVDTVAKFVQLADPSRRAYGPENDAALVSMAPTNPVGGVSRAVTTGVQYDLVLPSLDVYRDRHAEKFSNYCVPGDLVCDTRSVEAWRGVTLHVLYDNFTARCAAAGGHYTQFLDCLYVDVRQALHPGSQITPITDNPQVAVGPGWFNMTLSRGLRDELQRQNVDVVVRNMLGIAIGQGHSTIRAAGSGSVSALMPLLPAGPVILDIVVDGKTVESLPARYEYLSRENYTAVYVQPDGEDVAAIGAPVREQLTSWDTPFEQRMELVRSIFGHEAVDVLRLWFGYVYRYGWDEEHAEQLTELNRSGEIYPVDSQDGDRLRPLIALMTDVQQALGLDVLKFLNTVASVL
ncbi:cutinase family protein [Corynebacterium sp. 13CS0277]|uniref:cutinase family protein n=1 Tax=Corynebacterium sp. 13CS0277 TaxID=2071994 RepID=UPI00130503BD|nr:cutinase family protein [Corynebacterium sp. 13CS0277]